MIEQSVFMAKDVQLSASNVCVSMIGIGSILAVGGFNRSTWQFLPNTDSACTVKIEKSNDMISWEAARTATGAALTLQNSDGSRFTSIAVIDSVYQRARVDSPTAASSRALFSARFWVEVS